MSGRKLDGRTYDEMPQIIREPRADERQIELIAKGLKVDGARFELW